MLATCNVGVRVLRDRALLLLAWSGGGLRRSEVIGLQVEDLRRLDGETWPVRPRPLPLRPVAKVGECQRGFRDSLPGRTRASHIKP